MGLGLHAIWETLTTNNMCLNKYVCFFSIQVYFHEMQAYLGWGTICQVLRVLAKIGSGVGDHFPLPQGAGKNNTVLRNICLNHIQAYFTSMGLVPQFFLETFFSKKNIFQISQHFIIFCVILLHDTSLHIDFDRIFTSSWSKSEFIRGSRGSRLSRGSSQSGVIECSSEPPFHTCRGPG